jgi:predicted DNA-binding protein
MPFSVRLDEELQRKVGSLAKKRGIRPSQLVREALQEYVGRELSQGTPYELAKELIGSLHSGEGTLSETKGAALSEVIRQNVRRKARGRAH